jgi:photosystem II stability/assembly factor-like uncharacterized protein
MRRHLATLLLAGVPAITSAQNVQPFSKIIEDKDSALFTALNWKSIGPNNSGRSVAVASSNARPNEWYMGTTGGGVFKSVDSAKTWTPITDKYFGGTIGAIAVSESNPDIVYVGGGEFAVRGNTSHGDGMWKSTDAGKTWTFVGLGDARQIARVRVHPADPNVVYVAALGHLWGPNPERGIFRTRDGGKTWTKVLFRNDSTGAIELVLDPVNPNIMYAGFWQVHRKPWYLGSGGAGSGIFKSTDGGDTWKEITRNPGLPKGTLGNIGIAVSPVKPARVWALIEAEPDGGVYRSDDGGATWTFLSGESEIRQRPWYYNRIYAHPTDTNTVFSTNVGPYKSTDGGKHWRRAFGGGDNHDLWISRTDPNRIGVAHDGGVSITYDGGKTRIDPDLPTAQYYHVLLTEHFPYHICGSQQDGPAGCIPSSGFGGGFYGVAGCESGYIAVDPRQPDISYGGCYGGSMSRMDKRTGFSTSLDPWPADGVGHHAGYYKHRMQWTYPILFSPHDPNILYVGSNVVFKSTTEGRSWTAISPDLTRADPATLGPSGGPISLDQTSVEHYATVFAIAESPSRKGVIWTGSDDGLIHISRDAGKNWTNVTPKDMPPFTRVSIIEASPFDPGTVYVAANRFQLDDNAPYLYKSTDYGKSWTRIDNGIAPGEFTRVIRADPVRRGLLFAGTERGVWVSLDDGASWRRFQRGLPAVPIHDLAIKDGDLVAATHGRSFWRVSDLSTLRQYDPAIEKKSAHLYKPRSVYAAGFGGARISVQYWLGKGGEPMAVEVIDRKGRVVQSFKSRLDSSGLSDSIYLARRKARMDSLKKAGADVDTIQRTPEDDDVYYREGQRDPRPPEKMGINTFDVSPRYDDAVGFKKMLLWGGGTQGPSIIPGTYTVRLIVGNETLSQTVEVKRHPASRSTPADEEEKLAFLFKVRDRLSDANNAVRTVRNIRWQVADRKKRASDSTGIATIARTLLDSLTAVEEEIYQVRNKSGQDPLKYPVKLNNDIASLTGISSHDGPVKSQARDVFEMVSGKLEVQLVRLKKALDTQLPALNAELKRLGLPIITPSTEEAPAKEAVQIIS